MKSGLVPSAQDQMHQRRMQQKEAEIDQLQERVASLSGQLETALQKADGSAQKRRHHPLSPHSINVREVRTSNNKRTLVAQREKLGRNASIATQRVLDDNAKKSTDSTHPPYVQRILDMFQKPAAFMDYLNSELFAKDLLKLCSKVRLVLEREPRVVFLQSPAYVFGDIHGNLEGKKSRSSVWRHCRFIQLV
jgi:hypothetical protein